MLLLDAKTEDLIILMITIWMRFGECAGMYTSQATNGHCH